jgi:type IV secretory pathway VirB10-like protein
MDLTWWEFASASILWSWNLLNFYLPNIMTTNTTDSSPEESQPIRREIPPLGRNGLKKINSKILIFVLGCGLLTLGGFYYLYSKMAGSSTPRSAVPYKEEQLVIPERKRVGPLPSFPVAAVTTTLPSFTATFPGMTTNPFATNTLPVGMVPPGGISESLSIALKRALQGGSVFSGDAPIGVPGAPAADSGLSADERAARDAAAIIRRRTVEGGSVSDFLNGKPRMQPQSQPLSQVQNAAGLSAAFPGLSSLPGFGGAGGASAPAAGAGAGSAGAPGGSTGGGGGAGGFGGGPGGAAAGASQLAGILSGVSGGQQNQGQSQGSVVEPEQTSFPVTTARDIPLAPDTYIPQGTSIKCVMDSRLISDIPGQAMCNVAESIYGFNAKKVLIPKGSRLIGLYKRGADDGFDRVAVIWNRVITPSGIDIAMSNPGTDMLGGTGLPGYLDSHWGERLGAAVLISMGADIFKYASITNLPKVKKTIISPISGLSTVVEEPFDSQTVKTLSSIPEQILAKTLARLPTLIVNQGTLINVVTTRDLDFSTVY